MKAAETLEAYWQKIRKTEVPARPDALSALANAMVARGITGALVHAVDLGRQLIRHETEQSALLNVFQIAQNADDNQLSRQALDAIPNPSPRVKFFRALLYLEANEWDDAAECLASADVPDSEQTIANVVVRLAALRKSKTAADESEFLRLIDFAAHDPRALIVIARIAEFRGFENVAQDARQRALSLLDDRTSIIARTMVAAYFAERDEISITIDVLDGHVPIDYPSRELRWLADAHASERPPRKRNVTFFTTLPASVISLPEYARAYGSVLLDTGNPASAEQHFRAAFASRPEDTFVLLRLAETLQKLGRVNEARELVRTVDEQRLFGPPIHRMAFAHLLLNAAEGGRSLRFAYELVREYPHNPQVAMGYIGLLINEKDETINPQASVVAPDVWVSLSSDRGEKHAFVIDQGPGFLGLDVLPPNHAFVSGLFGLKVGDTVEIQKPFDVKEIWTVRELKSKYLHLLHVLMQDFERRFPNHGGMWRFSVEEGDATPILELVKKKGEADRDLARTYATKSIPLAFIARMMGGLPASFAEFLRAIGMEVLTCRGDLQERDAAISLAIAQRGRGIVIDEFTVWVAAEIGILDVLKDWFGRLLAPQAVIDVIDNLIARERGNLGRTMMTVAWSDGHYVRQEWNDELIQRQIDALERMKAEILAYCEVKAVVLPDTIAALPNGILQMVGDHVLDPIYMAIEEGGCPV